ncbi:MAG TPA: hypothetical protein VEB40_00915 [Flavipsychrobacter sp.]|nr:hypothetical protein [Flavipsychrobacter sp.]
MKDKIRLWLVRLSLSKKEVDVIRRSLLYTGCWSLDVELEKNAKDLFNRF